MISYHPTIISLPYIAQKDTCEKWLFKRAKTTIAPPPPPPPPPPLRSNTVKFSAIVIGVN
jgi:hypothetical protein